jgi:hypothetical protein
LIVHEISLYVSHRQSIQLILGRKVFGDLGRLCLTPLIFPPAEEELKGGVTIGKGIRSNPLIFCTQMKYLGQSIIKSSMNIEGSIDLATEYIHSGNSRKAEDICKKAF